MPESVIRLIPSVSGTRKTRIDSDDWKIVGLAEGEDLSQLPEGRVLVPLALWNSRRHEFVARGDVGVWLKPDDEPAELAGDVERLAVIALHFPKWGEGRGYSNGALLRTRHAYRGELRAFGDIGRDHLFNLARCGFDAFVLPPHRDPGDALAAFGDPTLRYQGAVDDPSPLFRKRALAGGLQ
jgi:uncharacterized protein (DUF934 family)